MCRGMFVCAQVSMLIYLFFPSYAVWGGTTGASLSFCTLCKNCYTMQMCNSIALIFGKNQERVMVDLHTKFVVNLRNIQRVMSIYSHKKNQASVPATG